ncbi:hypothetical protein [Pseudomonas kilonensis]|uniref:hypothetical protein n=1 Tax=Pseudomonas kilonensis TaxID=132476 RepID=UPI00209F4845|nr:hypothetical protein [Pseudomonas kilonensis]MCP1456118.1 hypothetical protein [Pseudomonas kilonensis]
MGELQVVVGHWLLLADFGCYWCWVYALYANTWSALKSRALAMGLGLGAYLHDLLLPSDLFRCECGTYLLGDGFTLAFGQCRAATFQHLAGFSQLALQFTLLSLTGLALFPRSVHFSISLFLDIFGKIEVSKVPQKIKISYMLT